MKNTWKQQENLQKRIIINGALLYWHQNSFQRCFSNINLVLTFISKIQQKSINTCQYLLTVKVLVPQSCLTLCDPRDCSPPGSSAHLILQVKIHEWVAISFSRGIFLTQRSNPCFLHRQVGSLLLSYQGSFFICI